MPLKAVAAAALALSLGCVPVALAGGDFLDLAAGGGRVWLTGPLGVRELDAQTGRTIWSPQPAAAGIPVSVALGGGAAWVATVANGYVAGRLSRIDLRSHRARVVVRNPSGSVLYVAAGGSSVWALLGNTRGYRVARLDTAGRLRHVWRVPGAGRLAADAGGCWISTDTAVLHIDPAGRLHRLAGFGLGDIAAGEGAAWLPQEEDPVSTSIVRIDERTGRTRRLHTRPLRLGGFQHDLAAGDGALWALSSSGRTHSLLVRLDPRTGATTGTAPLHGLADAVAVTPSGVWVAAVVAPSRYELARFDPRTLALSGVFS